jgi:pyruvate/oxaloacetate carboxyltransferase
MTTAQALSVLPLIRDAGFVTIEVWGGAILDSCVRYLNEDPWERLDAFHDVVRAPHKLRTLLRGQNLFAYQPFPDDLVIAFIKEAVRSGTGLIRIFDALNDWRNLQLALLAVKAYGGSVEVGISYTVSPIHTTDHFVDLALKLADEGTDRIAVKDMAGLLQPEETLELFRKLRRALSVPITFHSHCTTGFATLNAVIAMQEGADTIDTAITPFSGSTSHPPVEVLVAFAEALGIDHGLNKPLLMQAQARLFEIRSQLAAYVDPADTMCRPVDIDKVDQTAVGRILEALAPGDKPHLAQALSLMRDLLQSLGYPPHDDDLYDAQVPGGMISNLRSQLRQMGQLDRLDEILEEIPQVRADVGYVPLVTPTSQIVGSQATFNVMMGRYEFVSNEFRMLLRGEFGKTPAPPNPDVLRKVLGPEEEPLRYRPASYLSPVLEDNDRTPFVKTHRDLLLHLMLKQSADEFLRRKYAPS